MRNTLENIHPYDVERDEAAVFALWQKTVGLQWPVSPERFRLVLAGPEPQHFVLREEGQVIGFVATFTSQRDAQRVGQLGVLLIAPHRQRAGLGTVLHDLALKRLDDVSSIRLGSISPRFWCGVPGNLPEATAFFQTRGWTFDETVYDLVQDLHAYTTPPEVHQRMQREQIEFEVASEQSIADVLAFEAREFPRWLMAYECCAHMDDHQDLLIARDQVSGQIVGTLIMYSPQSHPDRSDLIWQPLLGDDAGSMGSVGVAASERKRGIGLALVAQASERLKARGVRNCYIDWVSLTDFYARLGYAKWRDYLTSSRIV